MKLSKRVVSTCLGIALGAFTAAGFATDHGGEEEIQSRPWKESVPGNNDSGVHLTPIEYAKLIEPELGVPPVVDCGENVEIPIYVDGVKYVGNPGLHRCDNPSLQLGDCMSGSSVGRYAGSSADGNPLPGVVWIGYCRHEGRNMGDVDAVQMIGYNEATGATAFYESGENAEWTYTDPETNRMMGKMPGPRDHDAFNRAYATVGNTQCGSCHQTGAFMHNPYIDAAKLPGTSEPVIPIISTRDADLEFDNPYYIIGASNWDLRTIHIDGNECLQCHRIGMKTIELYGNNKWHPNDYMPPKDPGSLAGDFQALLDCWNNGPENTPGCDWVVPPAGKSLGRVVGNEYPYAAKFNQPGAFYYADQCPSQSPACIFQSLEEAVRSHK